MIKASLDALIRNVDPTRETEYGLDFAVADEWHRLAVPSGKFYSRG
jgi:hypothetical protein